VRSFTCPALTPNSPSSPTLGEASKLSIGLPANHLECSGGPSAAIVVSGPACRWPVASSAASHAPPKVGTSLPSTVKSERKRLLATKEPLPSAYFAGLVIHFVIQYQSVIL
jgi:hypothetical protein